MQLNLNLHTRDLTGDQVEPAHYVRPKGSLLKWIGNKYRMAEQITSYFPYVANRYFDVFLGSGAILATIAPEEGCWVRFLWSANRNLDCCPNSA